MPFSHNLLAKLQVDSPAPFRFPRFSSVQWVLAFSCRLPLSSQVIPVFWADGKTYGGPQVSRQKFQVNTAQLKKIRQQLL